MKPILYCAMFDYENASEDDIDFITERILSKDSMIQFLGNDSFIFQKKEQIKKTLESVYREFAHIKELISAVTIFHVLDVEEIDLDILLDKRILH